MGAELLRIREQLNEWSGPKRDIRTVKVCDLSVRHRGAFEGMLGRPLGGNEVVSVEALSPAEVAERKAVAERLAKFLEARKEPIPGCSKDEVEAVILKALDC